MTFQRKLFTLEPWRAEFGDPADPRTLMGMQVQRRLLERRDAAGALVLLVDGRVGLTGRKVAVGPAWQLTRHLRRWAAHASSAEERAWYEAARASLARAHGGSIPPTPDGYGPRPVAEPELARAALAQVARSYHLALKAAVAQLDEGDGLRGQIIQLGQRVHALDRAALDRQFDEADRLRRQIVGVEAQVHERDAPPESGRLTS